MRQMGNESVHVDRRECQAQTASLGVCDEKQILEKPGESSVCSRMRSNVSAASAERSRQSAGRLRLHRE